MPTKYISKIHKGSDDLYIKDSEARTILDSMVFKDVYIGTGANAAAVMVAANHHDRINKGDHVSLTASSNKVWVIIPNTYSPTLTMTGIEVPMVAGSNITEGGVTYKVFSSANTYTGSMSVALY